jgi:NAD(P)-dependent dehydrogenase (short-subunit alcohol dehydrogenase family)
MSNSRDGKVVVVSGALMGVGKATAVRFVQDGAKTLLRQSELSQDRGVQL